MMPAKRNFIEDVKSLVGNEYTVQGEYVNNRTKIILVHNKCGYRWEVKPAHFLSGSRCPKCSHKIPYDTESFKERVFEIVGDEYEVLGEYVNSREKILFRHKTCGYSFSMTPNNFVQGNRCPKCSKLIRYTTKSFCKKVAELVGDEYTVLGEFVNSQTKIHMVHNACGTEFDITPSSFVQGHRCAKCSGVMRYTTRSFKERVAELVGDEFVVLGEYINNKTKIKMLHSVCGYEFDIKPNHFLSGGRCPQCSGRLQLTTDVFKERVKEQVGDEYSVIGEYINLKTKIKMKHNVCGCIYDVTPSNFLEGHGCPDCYKTIPYTTTSFTDKVFELVGDKYTVLGEYVDSDTKIRMKHNICGYEYDVRPSMFIRGNRCPQCSVNLRRSLPEEIVAYFVSQHFDIVQGYRPEWLKLPSGHNGEIDIWIPSLKIGIEYDGSIHGQEANYEKDIIKNNLIKSTNECKKLYRIREREAYDMVSDTEKVSLIKLQRSISLTSNKSRLALGEAICELLKHLGIESPCADVNKDIIILCQNKMEEYHTQIGIPSERRITSRRKTVQ